MKKIIRHENGHVKVITINNDPTLTQQQFKEPTDINAIMRKYRATGELPNFTPKKGVYGDFSNSKTYQESLHAIMDANKSFMTLPSDVRKRFSNDPEELFKFLSDKNNDEEAIKLGLKNKPPQKQNEQTKTNEQTTTTTQTTT